MSASFDRCMSSLIPLSNHVGQTKKFMRVTLLLRCGDGRSWHTKCFHALGTNQGNPLVATLQPR